MEAYLTQDRQRQVIGRSGAGTGNLSWVFSEG